MFTHCVLYNVWFLPSKYLFRTNRAYPCPHPNARQGFCPSDMPMPLNCTPWHFHRSECRKRKVKCLACKNRKTESSGNYIIPLLIPLLSEKILHGPLYIG